MEDIDIDLAKQLELETRPDQIGSGIDNSENIFKNNKVICVKGGASIVVGSAGYVVGVNIFLVREDKQIEPNLEELDLVELLERETRPISTRDVSEINKFIIDRVWVRSIIEQSYVGVPAIDPRLTAEPRQVKM